MSEFDDKAKQWDQNQMHLERTKAVAGAMLKQIPVKTYNQEEFLKNHRDLEYQDSLFTYLVRFRDFKIKESVSPLSFEKDRVKNIILNKRKIDLIRKMHNDIYEKASKNADFEIF